MGESLDIGEPKCNLGSDPVNASAGDSEKMVASKLRRLIKRAGVYGYGKNEEIQLKTYDDEVRQTFVENGLMLLL